MPVAALQKLRANYSNGQINMNWQYPPNAPETVFIHGVIQSGNEMTLDPRVRISNDLCNCTNGFSFDYSSISSIDVKKVMLCAYLSDRNSAVPGIRELQTLSECFVSVTIGRADVLFNVKSKPCGEGLTEHKISIDSSASFEAGILGYSYQFNGKSITIEFPGRIDRGATDYPAIYLMEDSNPPVVCIVDGMNTDITIDYSARTKFRFPFCRRRRRR